MKMSEEVKNIMANEVAEIKARLEKAHEEIVKAGANMDKVEEKLYNVAVAEGRYTEVYDSWACGIVKDLQLTEEEEKEKREALDIWQEACDKSYKIECEFKKAKKEQKRLRDIARGIDPEKKKAKTYARRYENEIEKLQKEIDELTEKMNYWKAKAE